MRKDYDLVVLGAGATGLGAARAARAARKSGRTVALVEVARPGGDCTHYGCVPSKALLETARRVAGARAGERYGFRAQVDVDFPAVMDRVAAVVTEVERDESPALLARQGIDLVAGWARFVSPHELEVGGDRLRASRYVLALGSQALVPPIDGLAALEPLTNKTIFALRQQPSHLLVLGGGPISCELAQAVARLGSRVTIIEATPRLLGKEEPEASRVIAEVLTREGVQLRLGVSAASASGTPAAPVLQLSDGTSVAGSHLLVAVGRRPATADAGLADAGVELDRSGRVVTDGFLRTSQPHIYAAGDCTSALQFTHVGDEQGRLAARNAFAPTRRPSLLGGAAQWDARVIPWVTFTEPEVGRVGLTEAQAFERYGERAMVTFVAGSTSDRGRTAGETDGFVKMVAAPHPLRAGKLLLRLVGMTAVAPTGGELVAEGALSMQAGTLVARMAQTVHAYPTWSLSTRLAAAQFFGSYGGRSARPARPARD